jgi:hypothetical protein
MYTTYEAKGGASGKIRKATNGLGVVIYVPQEDEVVMAEVLGKIDIYCSCMCCNVVILSSL